MKIIIFQKNSGKHKKDKLHKVTYIISEEHK